MRETESVLANALGERSGEYFSLNNNATVMNVDFAKTSQFHKEVMADGYVFNPYIHRRWLPIQYLRMRRQVNDYGYTWEWWLTTRYSSNYMIDYVIKETHKLSLLNQTDHYAFDERRQFFTEDCVKEIYRSYLKRIAYIFKNKIGVYCYSPDYVFIEGYGRVDHKTWTTVTTELVQDRFSGKYREMSSISLEPGVRIIENLIQRLDAADTYYEISKVMKDAPYFKTRLGLPDIFVDAFLKSGAYYTCKHLVMFNNKKINGQGKADACKILRGMLDSGASFEDFDKLID